MHIPMKDGLGNLRDDSQTCAILLPQRYPSVTPAYPNVTPGKQMAALLDFTIRQIDALPTPACGRAEYKDSKGQ